MKKRIITASLGVALAIASFSGYAQSNNSGLFVNGSVGNAHSDVSDLTKHDDTGYGINVGYRWNGWGIEAGYVDLGEGQANGYRIFPNRYNLRLTTSGWTLGANSKFNFARNWYLSARAGLFFSDTELEVRGYGKTKASDVNAYVGLGAGYDINQNMSIGVSFDRYLAKAEGILTRTNNPYMVSGTFEYRF